MANIFDGLNKLSNKDIIIQIALLENSNLKNASKPMINKVARGFAKITNYLSNLTIKDSIIKERESLEFNDLINKRMEQLEFYDREVLSLKLFELIKVKLGYTKDNRVSKDKVSVKMINEASIIFNIPSNETPSFKAQKIYELFYNYITNETNELEKSYKYKDSFTNLNAEDRLKAIKVINLEKEIILSPSYILLKGINNAEREVLATLIYLSILSYGQTFTPSIDDFKIEYNKEDEVKFSKLIKKSKNGTLIVIANNKKIEQFQNDIDIEYINIEKSKKKKSDTNEKNKLLKVKLNEYEALIKDKNKGLVKAKEKYLLEMKKVNKLDEIKIMEIKKVFFNYEKEYENLIDFKKGILNELEYNQKLYNKLEFEIEEKVRKINNLRIEINNLNIENKSILNIEQSLKEKVNEESKKREKFLKYKWEKTFTNFLFEKDVFNEVNKLEPKELIKVELSLFELQRLEDKTSISIGKTKELYNYFLINEINRNEIKIVYEIISNNFIRIDSIKQINNF